MREGCDKRFTLTRFHFGNAALMEHDTAEDLHTEGAFAKHAVCRLTYCRKCIGQNVVKRFSCGKTSLECGSGCLELGIAHGGIFFCQRVDKIGNCSDLFELALAVGSKQFGNE